MGFFCLLHLYAQDRNWFKTYHLMKRLILFCSIIFLFFSCENEKPEEKNIVGKWELVEIYNPWTVTASAENVEMRFQTYQFMTDGTFKKTRTFDENEVKEGTGTYEIENVPAYISSDARLYINLTYSGGESVVNNCGDPDKEQLVLRFSNQLSNFSATPCDGAGFTFEKK